MGMPDTAGHETRDTRRWTRDAVLALPDDGKRYELVDGELLVSPGPRGPHQRAVLQLVMLLQPYVREHRLGAICIAPADLDFRAGHLLQPDLFVGAMVDGHEPVEWDEFGVPILVVEVLSPSTARYDRVTKRRLYQRSGVAAYWIVDLDARLVEVWTPESLSPAIVDDTLTWQPDLGTPPLVIELGSFFASVHG